MKLLRALLPLAVSVPVFTCGACSGAGSRPLQPLAPPREEDSIRPGVNDDFLGKQVNMARWIDTFENESREIAAHKEAIVASMNLKKGQDVVDVGAGTGLFLEPLADAVGVGGKVYALDISPAFVEHLRERVKQQGLEQVEPRLSKERSVELPPLAVDAAFVCDTYHHLEYPQNVLFTLYKAMRPLGKVYVVDFEREPGVSRPWVLEHVRTGKDNVRKEIEKAGFVFEEELDVPGLQENYVLRFRRP